MRIIPTNTARAAAMVLALGLPSAVAAQGADAAAGAAATEGATETAAGDAYAPQKVVYHINYDGGEDGAGYNGALNNLRNHVDAVGQDNLDLRVVMHGNGIGLLQAAAEDQALQARIADLKAKGVDFLVCRNTLEGRDIDPASLFDLFDEDIVPSGVAEIGKLQMEGFAYIKP